MAASERIWKSLDDALERIADRCGRELPDEHVPFPTLEWNRMFIDIEGRKLREAAAWERLLLPALRTGDVTGAWRFADQPGATPQLLHSGDWLKVSSREDAARTLIAMAATGVRRRGRIHTDRHPREIQILADATEVDALLAALAREQVEADPPSDETMASPVVSYDPATGDEDADLVEVWREAEDARAAQAPVENGPSDETMAPLAEPTAITPRRGHTVEQYQLVRTWFLTWPGRHERRKDNWRALAVSAASAAPELKGINITHPLLRDVIRQYPELQARPKIIPGP